MRGTLRNKIWKVGLIAGIVYIGWKNKATNKKMDYIHRGIKRIREAFNKLIAKLVA
jgi:hypothetical protein